MTVNVGDNNKIKSNFEICVLSVSKIYCFVVITVKIIKCCVLMEVPYFNTWTSTWI